MAEQTRELERVAARLRALHGRRDELIIQASTEGLSLRKIATAAELSHSAIAKILAREDSTLRSDNV